MALNNFNLLLLSLMIKFKWWFFFHYNLGNFKILFLRILFFIFRNFFLLLKNFILFSLLNNFDVGNLLFYNIECMLEAICRVTKLNKKCVETCKLIRVLLYFFNYIFLDWLLKTTVLILSGIKWYFCKIKIKIDI